MTIPLTHMIAPKVRLRSHDDALAIVPALLGFQPAESLVLMVVTNAKVQVSARVDLFHCQPARLQSLLAALKLRYPDAKFFVVIYSANYRLANQVAQQLESYIGIEDILDSLISDGKRYWPRLCDEPRCQSPQGLAIPEPNTAVLAEVVGAGLGILSSREELANLVSAPNGSEAEIAEDRYEQASHQLLGLEDDEKACLLDELLGDLENQIFDSNFDAIKLVTLGVLVAEHWRRNHALIRVNQRNAARQCLIWQAVVRAMPVSQSVPALTICALSAWVSGDGAMQMICVDRALEIDPNYSLTYLLIAIHEDLLPPTYWNKLRCEMVSKYSQIPTATATG